MTQSSSTPPNGSSTAKSSWRGVGSARALTPFPLQPDRPPPWWRSIDVDGVFAFALFLPSLFLLQVGAFAAPAFVLLASLYAVVRRKSLLQTFTTRAFLMIPALLAMASAFWSDAPEVTVARSLGLAATLSAAFLLSSAASQVAVFRGVAAAFLAYVLSALVLEQTGWAPVRGGPDLVGGVASTGFVVSLGVLVLALKERAAWWAAAAAAAAVIDVSMALQSQSPAVMLDLVAALGAMAVLGALTVSPGPVRGLVTLMLALGVVSAAAFHKTTSTALLNIGSSVFGDDPTLNGRAELWGRAAGLIAERRLLGRGYEAFWSTGNAAAEPLRPIAAQVSADTASFHNTFVEMLVQFGWIGLWLMGAALLIGVVSFAHRFIQRPNLALCVWGSLFACALVRMPVESIGCSPFAVSTLILAGALGASFSPDPAPAPARKPKVKRVRLSEPAGVVSLAEYRQRRQAKDAQDE